MPMSTSLWQIGIGQEPLLATAIHDGHEVRDEVAELLALDEPQRLREEDPFTGLLATIMNNHIVPRRSRFEVDLNRPREKAVYVRPEDAWGLNVWKREPTRDLIERSLGVYDAFYEKARTVCLDLERRFNRFVVLDLHSYNHMRDGPDGPSADPAKNPEVNIGTGSMDRERWAPLVDRFIHDLRAFDFLGRHLDVRENVKFKGGRWSTWVHQNFPETGCAIAVEFKKFFMNEWTGELNRNQFEEIPRALEATIPGIHEELTKLGARF
jgi:N-formylglutamate deformylase